MTPAPPGYIDHGRQNLKAYNTLGFTAFTPRFIEVFETKTLKQALRSISQPVNILGQGSNIVMPTDIQQAVVHLRNEEIELDHKHRLIKAGAGFEWHKLVAYTLELNWPGLENLAWIPGTVGAAPVQNIGAYGTEIAQFIHQIDCYHLTTHESFSLDRKACDFKYRSSIFKKHPEFLITHVHLDLGQAWQANFDYPGLSKLLDAPPTASEIFQAVIKLRQQKLPDPKQIGNVGSFFKNPIIPSHVATQLKGQFPTLPNWQISEALFKVSAAWLIDQCGLKGKRTGNVGISEQHALVLVHYGHGTGQDLMQLAELVIQRVEQKFAIKLEPEPTIWP